MGMCPKCRRVCNVQQNIAAVQQHSSAAAWQYSSTVAQQSSSPAVQQYSSTAVQQVRAAQRALFCLRPTHSRLCTIAGSHRQQMHRRSSSSVAVFFLLQIPKSPTTLSVNNDDVQVPAQTAQVLGPKSAKRAPGSALASTLHGSCRMCRWSNRSFVRRFATTARRSISRKSLLLRVQRRRSPTRSPTRSDQCCSLAWTVTFAPENAGCRVD